MSSKQKPKAAHFKSQRIRFKGPVLDHKHRLSLIQDQIVECPYKIQFNPERRLICISKSFPTSHYKYKAVDKTSLFLVVVPQVDILDSLALYLIVGVGEDIEFDVVVVRASADQFDDLTFTLKHQLGVLCLILAVAD